MHGSQAAHVPESYKRYLANMFREKFDLFATPVAVEFRSDINPFLKRQAQGKARTQDFEQGTARAAHQEGSRQASAKKK